MNGFYLSSAIVVKCCCSIDIFALAVSISDTRKSILSSLLERMEFWSIFLM
jgi:hypothetical protein